MSEIKEIDNSASDIVSRAWGYHKAADELFAARINYAMIAHAMLVTGYATVISDARGLFLSGLIAL